MRLAAAAGRLFARERTVWLAVWRSEPASATISGVTTVLIVDDHPSFRASARALLEAEGFDVVGEAATGSAALREASALRPDVVLLDVQLPDFDGFEVTERLRDRDGAPEVILTSSRDYRDLGVCISSTGARGFVPKDELSGTAISALLAA